MQHTSLSRRGFIKTAGATTAGLTLGFHVPSVIRGTTADAAGPAVLNAWLRIAPDDLVTIVVSQSEMGQGVYTSLPMIVAEELECDWQKVRVEMAPVGDAYKNPIFHMQGTGGSTSVRAFMEPLRLVGAAAREMLKMAAAERWGCRSRSVTPQAAGSCMDPRARSHPTASWPQPPRRSRRQPIRRSSRRTSSS